MNNNFNSLRLLFAVFVLITHAYTLRGSGDADFLYRLTGGQMHFSYLGLNGLFALSGFLVFQSLQRSKSLGSYLGKRALRIFPALFLVLFLTLLGGAFVAEGSFAQYFLTPNVQSYVPRNLFLLKTQYELANLFEHNPIPRMVNGSIWSIPYEAVMYLALGAFFYFGKRTVKWVLAVLWLVLIALHFFFREQVSSLHTILDGLEGRFLLDLGLAFFAGTVMGAFGFEHLKRVRRLAVIFTCLILVSLWLGIFEHTRYLLFPPLVISVGLLWFKPFQQFLERLGDLSYGIYLYAFPVQQTLIFYRDLHTFSLLFTSLLISAGLAWVSWHLIEKRAMKWKTAFRPDAS